MSRWLLDDGPFGLLARVFDPGWRWPAARLDLAESVAASAGRDRSGRRGNLLAMSSPDGFCVSTHPILVGTDLATMIYGHLRKNAANATRDLGEDESIALCALHLPDALFVTMDKGAAYKALVELGPSRVSSPIDLWLELRAEALITARQFETLCDATVKGDSDLVDLPRRLLGP